LKNKPSKNLKNLEKLQKLEKTSKNLFEKKENSIFKNNLEKTF
jgi:hypothetical protein